MESITLGEILQPLGITLALFLGFSVLFLALSSLTATALKMLSRVNLVLLLASSLLGLAIGTFAGASRESVIGQVIAGLFAVLGTGGLLYVVIIAKSTEEQKKLVGAMLTMFSIAILLGAYYGGWSRIMVERYLPTAVPTEAPVPVPTSEAISPEEVATEPAETQAEPLAGVETKAFVPGITIVSPIPGVMPILRYFPMGESPENIASILKLLNSDADPSDKAIQLVPLLRDNALIDYFDPDTNQRQLYRWEDIKTTLGKDLIDLMTKGQAKYAGLFATLTIASKDVELMSELLSDSLDLEPSEFQQKWLLELPGDTQVRFLTEEGQAFILWENIKEEYGDQILSIWGLGADFEKPRFIWAQPANELPAELFLLKFLD